jgi:hypothetical protein
MEKMMNIKLEYLEEPKLQFGEYFEHEDSKTGLAEYGPFGKTIPGLHPSEIKLGFIGTRETITGAQEWITQCSGFIESENAKTITTKGGPEPGGFFDQELPAPTATFVRLNKILNPDFVGFNKDTSFNSCFQVNPRWERIIQPRELSSILRIEDKGERIWQLVGLFEDHLRSIAETDPTPDIVILALTPEMSEQADAVRLSGNFFLNFRRAIKARAMQQGIQLPIQILKRRTVEGKGNVQEIATRAWNFCTAQYYKANGIPWRPLALEQDTCYVGISFFVAQEIDNTLTMRSSVAQAFDYLGQGLVLRGDKFEWDSDSQGPSPHLTQSAARKLIKDILSEYVKLRGIPPKRVVIHKTSEYWGSEHDKYNELDGLYEGIEDVYRGCETDFVALRQTAVRLFREGKYPPLRGTYFSLEDTQHFLYTMGFIPYLETYPKPYVPEPWQITQHHGGSSPKEIFREVLALTKMNVNNCSFADGTPITISFAAKVGEIMKHIPVDGIVQPKYKFYM